MTEFTDYLQEVFENFGSVSARRMFGGYGIYHRDIMFALVQNDTLYLKADDVIAEHFIARDLGQFAYKRNGKWIKLSFYQAPEELFEDRELACEWAKRSYQVALQTRKKKG